MYPVCFTPGDRIFGDLDEVLVNPWECEAEVIERVTENAAKAPPRRYRRRSVEHHGVRQIWRYNDMKLQMRLGGEVAHDGRWIGSGLGVARAMHAAGTRVVLVGRERARVEATAASWAKGFMLR